jgi:hypothetical protein
LKKSRNFQISKLTEKFGFKIAAAAAMSSSFPPAAAGAAAVMMPGAAPAPGPAVAAVAKSDSNRQKKHAHVRVIEQPASKGNAHPRGNRVLQFRALRNNVENPKCRKLLTMSTYFI